MKRLFWVIALCTLLPMAAFCVVTLDGVRVETTPTYSDVAVVESIARAGTNAAAQAQVTAGAALPKAGGTMTGHINMNGKSLLFVDELIFDSLDYIYSQGTFSERKDGLRLAVYDEPVETWTELVLPTLTKVQTVLGQTNTALRAAIAAGDANPYRATTNAVGTTYTINSALSYAAPSFFPVTNSLVVADMAGFGTNGTATLTFTVRRPAGSSMTFSNAYFTATSLAAMPTIGVGTNYSVTVHRPSRSTKFIIKAEVAQ